MDCAQVGEMKKGMKDWPPSLEDLQKGWWSDVLWEPNYFGAEDQEAMHRYMTKLCFTKIGEYAFEDREGKNWMLKRYELDELKRETISALVSHFRNLLYPKAKV